MTKHQNRSQKGGVVEVDIEFTKTGKLMPHPVYAWMGWVAINYPEKFQWDEVRSLLDISYEHAVQKFSKK